MQTKTVEPRRTASHPLYLNDGLSAKKTALIIVTVIGCIAILWPKVFYPMMFGGGSTKPNNIDSHRGPGGCCDVVLDREHFLNASTLEIGPKMYRKQLNLYTGEISLRQERPTHLHPESIYQAMRERGRAIPPTTSTIPFLERKGSPNNPPPRIVEGRPGPIPGMRPPMGAGSLHQPQAKGTSMGFIMPLYTLGIIVFFGYTILKLVFKKPLANAPYGIAPSDPNFRKDVFGYENGRHVEDLSSPKIGWTEHQTNTRLGSELYKASLSATTAANNLSTSLHEQHQQHQLRGSTVCSVAGNDGLNKENDQLMEIEKLRKKLEDTERAMARLIAEMNSDRFEAKKTNDLSSPSTHEDITTIDDKTNDNLEQYIEDNVTQHGNKIESGIEIKNKVSQESPMIQRKYREGSVDRSVTVLGVEVTATCEGGQKWIGRPPTPVFSSHHEHSKDNDLDMPEPQEIYLEGSLSHESKILVSDSETKTEEVYDEELNGSNEEPAVVLSSKMTLSLINLDSLETNGEKNDIESPLADDIEIIGHDEK